MSRRGRAGSEAWLKHTMIQVDKSDSTLEFETRFSLVLMLGIGPGDFGDEIRAGG